MIPMARALVLALIVCVGCHAELGGEAGVDGGGGTGDGGGSDGSQLDVDAAPDGPACFNGRVVFLNFESVTLTVAPTSDATLNRASWMNVATGTTPRFRDQVATRQADIAAITTGVQDILSQFPVTVVTTRPAVGPYVMIAFGGTAANIGSSYGLAVNELDCDDSEKSDVAWISDAIGQPNQRLINTAVGAIGFGLGLTATDDPLDCMCGWANGCASNNTVPCTLSTSIDRALNATQQCVGATPTQNEPQAFSEAFCD